MNILASCHAENQCNNTLCVYLATQCSIVRGILMTCLASFYTEKVFDDLVTLTLVVTITVIPCNPIEIVPLLTHRGRHW